MERTEHMDYIVIRGLAAMAEKKLKLAKANPDNKTANTEAQFLIYAANAVNDTIIKEEAVVSGIDEAGDTQRDS